jgi:hypothetical protein
VKSKLLQHVKSLGDARLSRSGGEDLDALALKILIIWAEF